jgi:dUTP pyrophosphatase
MIKIQIKYLADIEKIKPIENGDWCDLRSSETITLKQGEYITIPLGVAMKLPPNYEAHVKPRSSTFKTWGILQVNSVATIDNSYCGPNDQWYMPVYATRDTIIQKNDRVCQFRIVEKQPDIEFEEDDLLDNVNRGGFGSTGIK